MKTNQTRPLQSPHHLLSVPNSVLGTTIRSAIPLRDWKPPYPSLSFLPVSGWLLLNPLLLCSLLSYPHPQHFAACFQFVSPTTSESLNLHYLILSFLCLKSFSGF